MNIETDEIKASRETSKITLPSRIDQSKAHICFQNTVSL